MRQERTAAASRGYGDMRPAENELRAWLGAIVESCGDAVVCTRSDGTILSWNMAAEALFGYSADEAIGQPIAMLVPPERQDELAGIQDRLARGERVPLETVRRRRDGKPVEVSLTIAAILHDGEIVGTTVVARPTGERRRYEESLRDREERLSSALLASGTGTFRWHIASDRLEWDESLRRLFGLDDGDPIRRAEDFVAFIHPDDRAGVWAEVERCLRDGGAYVTEFRIVRPDGAVRWISDKARVFFDEAGRPAHLTGACRDVTEEREAADALRAALTEKELLLAQQELLLKEVNHRVKNGLQTVASLLSLQMRHAGSPEVRAQLADARSRVLSVALVHERLYQSNEIGIVKLQAYLRGLCDDLMRSAAGSGVEIVLNVVELSLPADRVIPIGLIINELATSAMRHAYRGRGGIIEVTTALRPRDMLEVRVRDSGLGTASEAGREREAGFGMKLVNGLLQQLGGRMEVRARKPGTEVIVLVPLAAPPETEAAEPTRATA